MHLLLINIATLSQYLYSQPQESVLLYVQIYALVRVFK